MADLELTPEMIERIFLDNEVFTEVTYHFDKYSLTSIELLSSKIESILESPQHPAYSSALSLKGDLYYYGKGVVKDHVRAATYFEIAAKLKNSYAIFSLGCMYANGQGVKQDYQLAKNLFEQAASSGCYRALTKLGNLYFSGDGVKRDFSVAKNYYEEAIRGGEQIALQSLAGLYKEGKGVEVDLIKAVQLYRGAFMRSVDTKKELLEVLEKSHDPKVTYHVYQAFDSGDIELDKMTSLCKQNLQDSTVWLTCLLKDDLLSLEQKTHYIKKWTKTHVKLVGHDFSVLMSGNKELANLFGNHYLQVAEASLSTRATEDATSAVQIQELIDTLSQVPSTADCYRKAQLMQADTLYSTLTDSRFGAHNHLWDTVETSHRQILLMDLQQLAEKQIQNSNTLTPEELGSWNLRAQLISTIQLVLNHRGLIKELNLPTTLSVWRKDLKEAEKHLLLYISRREMIENHDANLGKKRTFPQDQTDPRLFKCQKNISSPKEIPRRYSF